MKKNYLLVNGSIDLSNYNKHNIYAIGEHCLINNGIYDYKNSQNIKVLKFHWKDRKKLELDYLYLENLFEKILKCLSDSLNQYHGTKNNLEYWRIILSPWIMDYIGTIFDRWENITYAFNNIKIDAFFALEQKQIYIKDYLDFKENTYDETWNSSLYQEIIKIKKIHVNIEKINTINLKSKVLHPEFKKNNSSLNFKKNFMYWLSRFFYNKDTLIKSVEFNFLSFLKMSLKTRSIIFNDKFFDQYLFKNFDNKHDRNNFDFKIETSNDFEMFLKKKLKLTFQWHI